MYKKSAFRREMEESNNQADRDMITGQPKAHTGGSPTAVGKKTVDFGSKTSDGYDLLTGKEKDPVEAPPRKAKKPQGVTAKPGQSGDPLGQNEATGKSVDMGDDDEPSGVLVYRSSSSGALKRELEQNANVDPILGTPKPYTDAAPGKSAGALSRTSETTERVDPITGQAIQVVHRSSSAGSMNKFMDGSAENNYNILSGKDFE